MSRHDRMPLRRPARRQRQRLDELHRVRGSFALVVDTMLKHGTDARFPLTAALAVSAELAVGEGTGEAEFVEHARGMFRAARRDAVRLLDEAGLA